MGRLSVIFEQLGRLTIIANFGNGIFDSLLAVSFSRLSLKKAFRLQFQLLFDVFSYTCLAISLIILPAIVV